MSSVHQLLRLTIFGETWEPFEQKDLLTELPWCTNLRELITRHGYPEPIHHECPLPNKPCNISIPFLTKAICSSSFSIVDRWDAVRLFHVLAHAPLLDDLQINCTNFKTHTRPQVFPKFALKRYAFHHWGYGDGMVESVSSGWWQPLQSSTASLQSFELTIRNADDLIECNLTDLLRRGALFHRLKRLKISIAWNQTYDAFVPLLVLCPRVQDLTISVDAYGQQRLPPFGLLIHALPNSAALQHLTIGLRMWNSYYHVLEPERRENEYFDRYISLVVRYLKGRRLRSFSINVDKEVREAFTFPLVVEECRSRRVVFAMNGLGPNKEG